jgi:hypothetical protein
MTPLGCLLVRDGDSVFCFQKIDAILTFDSLRSVHSALRGSNLTESFLSPK